MTEDQASWVRGVLALWIIKYGYSLDDLVVSNVWSIENDRADVEITKPMNLDLMVHRDGQVSILSGQIVHKNVARLVLSQRRE